MLRNDTEARMDELLSAYIDGELTPEERARLEARLAVDPELQGRLEGLRRTVSLLQDLPQVPAPRNFLLAPSMITSPSPRPQRKPARRTWLAPALSFATAVSAILCVIALVGLFLAGGRAELAMVPPTPRTAYEVGEQTAEMTEPPDIAPVEEDAEGGMAPAGTQEPPTLSPERVEEEAPTPTPSSLGVDNVTEPPPAPFPPSPTLTAPPATPTPAEEPPRFPPPQPEEEVQRGSALPLDVLRILAVGLALLTTGLAGATVLAWRTRRG